MLKLNVITLFPELFKTHLENLPFKKALSKGFLDVKLVNLRDYALDSYGTVDDKPYGGGVGMLLMIEPIYNALVDLYGANFEKDKNPNRKIILLSPRGQRFSQQAARSMVKNADKNLEEITFVCGRYEGIDNRVEEYLATDTISVGDFVVSGGELPALLIMEAVTRLLPGVLEKSEASQVESFSDPNRPAAIEFPQYTRPENFKGFKVPDILLSGNHQEIKKWREGK